MNGYGDYYWGLYRDYHRDHFPHSLLSTRQISKTTLGRQILSNPVYTTLLLQHPVRALGSIGFAQSFRDWGSGLHSLTHQGSPIYIYIYLYIYTYIYIHIYIYIQNAKAT